MDNEGDHYWNKCDACGRFISFDEFEAGAIRRLVYPDSDYTRETWETLCSAHRVLASIGGGEKPDGRR
jgi:hypothetical protein